ncbi:MAG: class I SAM-dependent methyltransferase [Candidatus Omnitrophica bacterium]|nr:class I SAM-dependent methyltransferase [Candidatus Omnitrophota bacterium]
MMKRTSSHPPNQNACDRSEWWREWFNHLYLDVYAHRSEDDAEAEIAAALAVRSIQPQDRILDLCCGAGRHCRALRRAGRHRVIGLDYSLPLLQHAATESPHECYVRGDMRLLPFHDEEMDAVLSFFTSFGYFTTNLENLAVLHEIARVLRSNGQFLLDYLNPVHVRRTFAPESEKKHGDYTIREHRSLSSDGERIEKEIIIENWGGENHVYHESVRLYDYDQMMEMLQSADLQVEGVLGAFDQSPFQEDSERMILYGYKK